jgi:hypothetical protein
MVVLARSVNHNYGTIRRIDIGIVRRKWNNGIVRRLQLEMAVRIFTRNKLSVIAHFPKYLMSRNDGCFEIEMIVSIFYPKSS